jgi:hypothetical protein
MSGRCKAGNTTMGEFDVIGAVYKQQIVYRTLNSSSVRLQIMPSLHFICSGRKLDLI